MQIKPKEAASFIVDCIKAKLVCMLHGSPGIGKSDIVRQIADAFGLHMIDVRLSQCDPVDLNGFPSIKNGTATYVPMNVFPLEDTVIPKDKCGFLLFLDEFNSASLATQAASYKIILDRMVGQHKLHPNTAIVCAGNMAGNNAIVNRLSTAMQSRLVHFELTTDIEQWLEWATRNNIDYRVTGYLNSRPDNLLKFDANHNDKTFACPRTWQFVSKLIKDSPGVLGSKLPLLAGAISEGIAREFIAYTNTYEKLPTIDQIIQNPKTTKIDTEPCLLYAISYMVSAHAKVSNLDQLFKFINRLPIEFATITCQNMLFRDATLIKEQPFKQWIDIKGDLLF